MTAEACLPQNVSVIDDPDGCGPTLACGSMLNTMAKGKGPAEAAAVEAAEAIAALGGLPAEHVLCAKLQVAVANVCPQAPGGGE